MGLNNKNIIVLNAGIRQDIAKHGKIGENLIEMFTVLINSSQIADGDTQDVQDGEIQWEDEEGEEESGTSSITDKHITSNKRAYGIFRDMLLASSLFNIVGTEVRNSSKIGKKAMDKFPEAYRCLYGLAGSVPDFFSTITPVLDRLGIEITEVTHANDVVNLLNKYSTIDYKEIDLLSTSQNAELNRDNESSNSSSSDEDGSSYDAWEDMINLTIERILVNLDELYTSGYEGTTPAGLLIGEYILSVRCKSDGSGEFEFYNRKKNAEMYKLYKWINRRAGGIFDMSNCHGNMKPSIENFGKGVGYYPNYQMRNASGLKGLDTAMDKYICGALGGRGRFNNFNELSKYLRFELNRIIRKGFQDANIDPDDLESKKPKQLVDKFASIIPRAILITDWNTKTAVKLKICCGDDSILARFTGDSFRQAIANGEILSPHIKVGDTMVRNGVLTTILLFNESMYYNYPLFAYTSLEAIKRTGKIDWGSVILGVKSDDRIARINLKDNKAAVISMLAGTRSGKGVMTLNLIASAMACGYPILYMDCKPEMSRDLWQLANKYGKEMFAFDGAPDSMIDVDRKVDIGYDTGNLPEPFVKCMEQWPSGGVQGFARFTCYVRGIEFLNLLIRERAAATAQGGSLLDELGGERLLFVLDELENFFKGWGSLKAHVETLLGIYEEEQIMNGTIKKADKNMNPFRQYWSKYRNWVKTQFLQLNALSTGKMSQANINIFVIAQTVEIDKLWDKELSPLVGGIIKKMSLRICGNGTSGGEGSYTYGTGKLSDSQKSLLTNWYFAVSKKAATNVLETDNVDMVRPYFLLPRLYNEDGSESKALQDLRSGTLDKFPEVADEITGEDGRIMPEIAFEGYVQSLLGGDKNIIGNTLGCGWDIATKLIGAKAGTDIVSFMYNLTNFSIFQNDNAVDMGDEDLVLPEEASNSGWLADEEEEQWEENGGHEEDSRQLENEHGSEEEVEEVAGDIHAEITKAEKTFGRYGGSVVESVPDEPFNFGDSLDFEGENSGFDGMDSEFKSGDSPDFEGETSGFDGDVLGGSWDIPSDDMFSSDEDIDLSALAEKDVYGEFNNESVAKKPEAVNKEVNKSNVLNIKDIYLRKGINPQDVPKEAVEVREVHTNSQAYQTGKGKDFNVMTANTENINIGKQKLTQENSVYCSPSTYVPTTKYDKLMCKSPFGIKHWRKKMFEKLLNDIDTYGNGLKPIRTEVNSVTMKKECLFVNSRICNTNGSYGGNTGRNLSDYVIFSMLAKRCPTISTLKMDDSFIKAFMMETGLLQPDDYIAKLFGMFTMLTTLELDGMKLSKTDFLLVNEAAKNQRKLDEQERKIADRVAKEQYNLKNSIEKERAKDDFDASLKRMVPPRSRGDEYELARKSATASKNYWSKTERALMEEGKKGKALGYGIFTVVGFGVAAVTGIGGLILHAGRKVTSKR